MNIAGIVKLSLVDYPGKACAVVFLKGCNLACPFCHNTRLIDGGAQESVSQEEVLAYLTLRKNMLDGVCISGGEPLLASVDELTGFFKKTAQTGLKIKLDTNGTQYEKLLELSKTGLVNYVAMDVKNCQKNFLLTAGMQHLPQIKANGLKTNIENSLKLLFSGGFEGFELRTTVAENLHSAGDIGQAAAEIAGLAKECGLEPQKIKYFLQPYSEADCPGAPYLQEPSESFLAACLSEAKKHLPLTQLR